MTDVSAAAELPLTIHERATVEMCARAMDEDGYQGSGDAIRAALRTIDSLTAKLAAAERRREAAERYIAASPCDPDITDEQIQAYRAWKDLLPSPPEREG